MDKKYVEYAFDNAVSLLEKEFRSVLPIDIHPKEKLGKELEREKKKSKALSDLAINMQKYYKSVINNKNQLIDITNEENDLLRKKVEFLSSIVVESENSINELLVDKCIPDFKVKEVELNLDNPGLWSDMPPENWKQTYEDYQKKKKSKWQR